MNILSVDTGYGSTKVVYGDANEIRNIYKFPSVIANVSLSDMVTDTRVVSYNDKSYYIGADALQVQASSIINIDNYKLLEYFSPLFVYKAISDLQAVPDKIVLGLSIAQISNSGYYKDNIQDFLRKAGLTSEIYVVPQGAIAKKAIDKYGMEFPEQTKVFAKDNSYLIADIGFNTLDVCHVINGVTSSNLVRGIENRGAIVIVQDLIIAVKKVHNITLNTSEASDLLTSGTLKRRGINYPVTALIEAAKAEYIDNLKIIIENEFGSVLDKLDNLIIIGGGAYFLNAGSDGFIKSPANSAEFYNSIGYYLYGCSK